MAKAPQLTTSSEKIDALGTFEGAQVIATGIEMLGAGGGLHDALAVDPLLAHKDDTLYVLVKTTVGKIRFDPIPDSEDVKRVHVLKVDEATIVDEAVAVDHLDRQRERIEQARGIERLPFGADDEATVALRGEHAIGEHADGLVPGCPLCDEETGAVADEAAADGNVTPIKKAAPKKAAAKKAPAK